MSLPHAILGLLTLSPMTGYELKHQAFDHSIAHFWQADQAQIYRTLTTLVEAGWVDVTVEIQQERPNRKVHSITEAGREELQRWLLTRQPLPVHREPFLVQMFFAGSLDRQTVLDHLAYQRAQHEAVLERYRQIPLDGREDSRLARDHSFWQLTLDMGMAMEQMYLDWLTRCEQVVAGLPDAPSTASPDDEPLCKPQGDGTGE